jgi:hypothetical protein
LSLQRRHGGLLRLLCRHGELAARFGGLCDLAGDGGLCHCGGGLPKAEFRCGFGWSGD